MLRKLRIAMGDQNSLYKLTGTIELDDAFVGGEQTGKRGRGTEGKTAILVACEHNDGKPGVVAMKVVSSVNRDNVRKFAQESIEPGQPLNTDALRALRVLTEEHHHIAKVHPLNWLMNGYRGFI